MNVKTKILSIGALLILAGAITAVMRGSPSQLLQYIFIGISIGIGALGIAIGRRTSGPI